MLTRPNISKGPRLAQGLADEAVGTGDTTAQFIQRSEDQMLDTSDADVNVGLPENVIVPEAGRHLWCS
jgi:hypothetical protein